MTFPLCAECGAPVVEITSAELHFGPPIRTAVLPAELWDVRPKEGPPAESEGGLAKHTSERCAFFKERRDRERKAEDEMTQRRIEISEA